MKLKENDVLLCSVEKIEGTTVFLRLESGEKGTMILSEVAAGRIRNLREYVFPGKKIVCKVLKIAPEHIELSFRRVTAKEKEHVLDKYKKESALRNVFKTAGENAEKLLAQIKEEYDLNGFLDEARENPSILEKFVKKEKAQQISKMIAEKGEKKKIIVKKFVLRSVASDGAERIKNILKLKEGEIHYLGSGFFSLSISGVDFKEMNSRMNEILKEIEKRAKEKGAFFELRKDK